MNVTPVHVSTVELAWTECTTSPVFVQACLLENVVKVSVSVNVLLCNLIIWRGGMFSNCPWNRIFEILPGSTAL